MGSFLKPLLWKRKVPREQNVFPEVESRCVLTHRAVEDMLSSWSSSFLRTKLFHPGCLSGTRRAPCWGPSRAETSGSVSWARCPQKKCTVQPCNLYGAWLRVTCYTSASHRNKIHGDGSRVRYRKTGHPSQLHSLDRCFCLPKLLTN